MTERMPEQRDTAFDPYRIGVVIPTMDVRPKHHLDRAIRTTCPPHLESLGYVFAPSVQLNYGTCGEAWNVGQQKLLAAGAEYLLLAADDLELRDPEVFYSTAVDVCNAGQLPAFPVRETRTDRVYDDGQPGTEVAFARVPFLSATQARALLPIPNLHYYSDYCISARGRKHGWATVMQGGAEWVHHWAIEGRQHDDLHDRKLWDETQAAEGLA
jgi:hypothetical protein